MGAAAGSGRPDAENRDRDSGQGDRPGEVTGEVLSEITGGSAPGLTEEETVPGEETPGRLAAEELTADRLPGDDRLTADGRDGGDGGDSPADRRAGRAGGAPGPLDTPAQPARPALPAQPGQPGQPGPGGQAGQPAPDSAGGAAETPRRTVSLIRLTRRRRRPPKPAPQPLNGRVVACNVYWGGRPVDRDLGFAEAARMARRQRGAFAWIGLHKPGEQLLNAIGNEFGLHTLAVEDAFTAQQRPKIEKYDDHLFMAMKTARYVEHDRLTPDTEVIETAELMVFVGSYYVITVRHGSHGELTDLRRSLEGRPELLRHGPAAVLHAICDRVVDDYLNTVEKLQVDIHDLEAAVFTRTREPITEQVYHLKREILELKHAVVPLAGPLRMLAKGGAEFVDATIRNYFRDVADHLTQVIERIAHFDELLSSLLQATLTQVSIAQNEDMRKISAWVAIAAIPTAIAAIYGMNFEHMPELAQPWGYPAVLGLMLVLCVALYWAFKRNKWL